MKIIYLTVTTDLTYDQRMQRICTSLAKTGYEVHLIGRALPNSVPLTDQPFQQHRLQCRFHRGKLFYLEFNLRLLWLLLFQKMDALCAVDLDTLMPGTFVAGWKQIPLVYDAHEYFSELPEVVERPFVKKIWEWLACRCIPFAKAAYTVGDELAQIFTERYHISFKVIRNVPFQKPFPTTAVLHHRFQKRILLYQGALNEGRGLEAVLEAMQELENVELWLAGEGDLFGKLGVMARELSVADKVKFLGYVQPAELIDLTQKASIGLNLLENKGLNYYYSLANKCFDYIQAGVPALHMQFPEYERINRDFEIGILLPDLAVDRLVNTVKSLLDDKERYMQLAKNCQQAAAQLNWEKEEPRLFQIYQEVLPL